MTYQTTKQAIEVVLPKPILSEVQPTLVLTQHLFERLVSDVLLAAMQSLQYCHQLVFGNDR